MLMKASGRASSSSSSAGGSSTVSSRNPTYSTDHWSEEGGRVVISLRILREVSNLAQDT